MSSKRSAVDLGVHPITAMLRSGHTVPRRATLRKNAAAGGASHNCHRRARVPSQRSPIGPAAALARERQGPSRPYHCDAFEGLAGRPPIEPSEGRSDVVVPGRRAIPGEPDELRFQGKEVTNVASRMSSWCSLAQVCRSFPAGARRLPRLCRVAVAT